MSDPDPTRKIVEGINRGQVDILANRIIQVLYLKNMDYSFPMSRDDKYFIVPKPEMVPSDLLIVFTFTQTVWAALLTTIVILTLAL
ncbi:unnamed protein product, partial [Callosobruchus maculatus]